MAENQSTFIEELMAAGQGVFGFLRGDSKAAGFFDLGPRGLVGGIIARLLVVITSTVLQTLMTPPGPVPPSAISVPMVPFILLIILSAASGTGVVGLALQQFKRREALVPYLVVDFWTKAFVALVGLALIALGTPGLLLLLVVGAATLITEINVARLLVALPPGQIAILIAARYIVEGLVALLIFSLILSPEDLSQLMNSASS